MLPKLHASFKIGGLVVALVSIAAQVAAITGGIPHPSATLQAVNSACITIGLIAAALGVHPGDTTAQAGRSTETHSLSPNAAE